MLKKIAGNVPGRFTTTEACIACDACRTLAPHNFAALPSGEYIVARQPSDAKELAAVLEAYRNTFAPNGPGPCIVDLEDSENIPPDFDSV